MCHCHCLCLSLNPTAQAPDPERRRLIATQYRTTQVKISCQDGDSMSGVMFTTSALQTCDMERATERSTASGSSCAETSPTPTESFPVLYILTSRVSGSARIHHRELQHHCCHQADHALEESLVDKGVDIGKVVLMHHTEDIGLSSHWAWRDTTLPRYQHHTTI